MWLHQKHTEGERDKTFSPLVRLQLNASSQNSVRTEDAETSERERFKRKSLKPGTTDFWMATPMAPVQKLNLIRFGSVIQASLPIHWRGGPGCHASSSKRIFKSPGAANATTTVAVDLKKQKFSHITLSFYESHVNKPIWRKRVMQKNLRTTSASLRILFCGWVQSKDSMYSTQIPSLPAVSRKVAMP